MGDEQDHSVRDLPKWDILVISYTGKNNKNKVPNFSAHKSNYWSLMVTLVIINSITGIMIYIVLVLDIPTTLTFAFYKVEK